MRVTLTTLATAVLLSLAFLTSGTPGRADEPTPEQKLLDKAKQLEEEAVRHYMRGDFAKAAASFEQGLEIERKAYPRDKYPNGHTRLANTINNIAFMHFSAGDYGKAELHLREALVMCRHLFPKEKYPKGDRVLARIINSVGFLYQTVGDYNRAEPLLREALRMRRQLLPKEQYPKGDPELANSIGNLAGLYQAAGNYSKAKPLYREALLMFRDLLPKDKYPNGVPDIARMMMGLGSVHFEAREYGKAEPLIREALLMFRHCFPKKKYPNGQPELAGSINNLAELYQATGNFGKAEPLSREALLMCRQLFPKEKYPNGHPLLASMTGNLARLHQLVGDYSNAEPHFREALLMCRQLFPKENYPNGHPELAASIDSLAVLYYWAGDYAKAEPLYREALLMYGQLLRQYAELRAEAESLNFAAQHPLVRDSLVSNQRHRPEDPTLYDLLWEGRATLTRLQERRHRDLMASQDKATAALAEELRLTRMSLAGLLLRPGRDADAHRKKIEQLTETKEDLEKRIAARLKLAALKPATEVTTVNRLSDALPAGAAFVDIIRYVYFEQDPKIKGKKGMKWTPSYIAFVVRKGQPVAKVELGEAKLIDDAWAAWHKAITVAEVSTTSATKAERDAAKTFAQLVWEPIRKQLPDKLKTVYLAPDGKLAQVPWAALPGKKADTVLLDEHAVCLVPHGPWLLERLEEKAARPTGSTLVAYGGVDYDHDPAAVLKPRDDVRGPLLSEKRRIKWGELPGTAKEQAAIVALAKKALKDRPIARSGRDANTMQLEEDLPKARYAHIATHGFFADPEFRSALQVDPKLFEYRGFGERRGGARSPLVLSGLVLAGANRQGEDAAPDHGIITAEGLIGLRMEGLELAVLSACETGLGESGGGEGVYGLQRAFHVAGCKNVIASLWKVDDTATQALMTLFYRNLWEKKLDAAEALRQAQLTIYRNPAAVEVVKKRGTDFTESDLPEVKSEPGTKLKHAPTAHWAAFTFSGVRPAK
jgi:CHAT domain-containing protein